MAMKVRWFDNTYKHSNKGEIVSSSLCILHIWITTQWTAQISNMLLSDADFKESLHTSVANLTQTPKVTYLQ